MEPTPMHEPQPRSALRKGMLQHMQRLSLSALSALALLLTLVALAFVAHHSLQLHERHLEQQADALQLRLQMPLDAARDALEALAAHGQLVQALTRPSADVDVDVEGAASVVRGHRLPLAVSAEMAVLDARLVAVAGSQESATSQWRNDALARLALDSGLARLQLRTRGDSPWLMVALPVFAAAAADGTRGRAVGVVLAALDLTQLLRDAIQSLPRASGRPSCVALHAASSWLLDVGCAELGDGDSAQASRNLQLSALRRPEPASTTAAQGAANESAIALQLVYREPTSDTRWRVLRLFALFALAAGAAVALVHAVLGRRCQHIVQRLVALESAAHTLAEQPAAAVRAEAGDADEISRTGRSFNRMVDQFQALQAQQEQRVLQRTADLAQARDEADAASRVKSEFIAAMSHEIRAPLGGVLGMSELLLHTRLDADQREYAEVIHSCGQQLHGIINNILDFSSLGSGSIEIEDVDFTLQDVFGELRGLYAQRAQAKGLKFECTPMPGLATLYRGDPLHVRQILANLVDNAIKFTETGSVEVHASALPGDAGVRFVVRDSGIGIEPQEQQRIFDAFTHADDTLAQRSRGTGLGLALCQRLCKRLGGSIHVVSSRGWGSSFVVELPLRAAADAAPPRKGAPTSTPEAMPAEAVTPTLQGRVLIVDDNAANQKLLQVHLKQMGLSVEQAQHGAQALEMLEQGAPIDLVLMDCRMPVMDGYEATRRWRAIEAARGDGRHLPIIAVTANAMEGDHQRALQSGMDGYLSKPIMRPALARMLAQWLGGRGAADR